MKSKIAGFIEFLAIVFVLGTVGSCDCGNISLTQTVIQFIIGGSVIAICHRIRYVEWERYGDDYEEDL